MPERAGERRTIALAGRPVAYLLCRSRRRTIGLSIDQRGLRVGAPPRAALRDIESLIHQHAGWVLDKLERWENRPLPAPLEIRDGMTLPCLGRELTVHLAAGTGSRSRALWAGDGLKLTLLPAPGADPRGLLEQALRQRAREVFVQRLAHYAGQLAVAVPPLALSSAKTRWGSCSRRSGIRLNWRLIFFPWPVIDYVVAHELAHLKEMNHSPAFWSVVENLYPDWRQQRAELKRLAATLPHF